MSVHIGEVWSDVPPLPKIRSGEVDLYLRYPTIRSAQRSRENLVRARYDACPGHNPYILRMPCVNPHPALQSVIDMLTPPERTDTLALMRPCGTPLLPIDRVFAMSVEQLCNRLGAEWLVEVLRKRRLAPVFQPIVSAVDPSSRKGYEVLMRGHYDDEDVDARRMFAVAESANIMSQLDALAMQTAVEAAARAGIEEMLFVNCSPAHMHDPHTRVSELAEYCRRLGLDPSQIVLEVVETERHDKGHLRTFLLACRREGFQVALDDLGSGYSSLAVLEELRPDILKFDRELVKSVNSDPYRALILSRLLEASRILGLSTVVEGIETAAELAWAAANGATYVQGNFIAKAAPLRHPR